MGHLQEIEPVHTSASLEWTKKDDGIYGRDLDSVEQFYDFISKVGIGRPEKTNWSVSMGLKVSTEREDLVGDIKRAWIALRQEFPSLAAFIQKGKWVYNTIDREGLGHWLEETLLVHHDIDKPCRSFFPLEDMVQSNRAVLHVFPNTHEMVIQGPHTHLDGTGMILFFDKLLKILVSPVLPGETGETSSSKNSEVANLVPPLAITAQIPEPSLEQRETFSKSMGDFLKAQPGIKLSAENTTSPAAKSRLLWLTFNMEQTKQIAVKSKSLGVTVTAALQAAITHASRIHGGKNAREHAIMALYDARSYIDAKTYPRSRLISPQVFAMPAVYPALDSFAETARAARHEFLRFAEGDVVRATSPLWAKETIDLLSMPLPAGASIPGDLNFSSLGVLDRLIQPFYRHGDGSPTGQERPGIEVMDLWIGLDMLHPTCLVEAWTFKGRLRVELIYNEAYHTKESMEYLCSLIHEQLSHGLGLDLTYDLRGQGQEEWFTRE
ncbi:hypothetical protein VP1G_08625 [Cytospora mali]|uniref:Uncharacterized protein n=1 Tax=Cytospora mali TaxID=578113 RepID=A0A194VC37_CYTMA|nr:hypothetical protein VP1G_08625 [Valsa mali var. pyri (nom. inval.)]